MIYWRKIFFGWNSTPEIIIDERIHVRARKIAISGSLGRAVWHSFDADALQAIYYGKAGFGWGMWESRNFYSQVIICFQIRGSDWVYVRKADALSGIDSLISSLASKGVTVLEAPPKNCG